MELEVEGYAVEVAHDGASGLIALQGRACAGSGVAGLEPA